VHHVEILVEDESIGALATPFTIGRDPECDVILPDSSVSRRHVKVTSVSDGLFIEDMGSSNGTWLSGRRISREVVPSDQPVVVGRVGVTLRYVREEAVPQYQQPKQSPQQESRHATLEVDVPKNYFEQASNAPAVRTFDCPSCSKRLRCTAETTRVKCRNCAAIIRFEGATPQLENDISAPNQLVRPAAKEIVPPPAPPVMTPEPQEAPLGTSGLVLPSEPPPRTIAPHFEEESEASLVGFIQDTLYTTDGKIAVALFAVGALTAILGTLATLSGEKGLVALVVVAAATAVCSFAYLMANWVIETIQPQNEDSLEERLGRLKTLRERDLISDDEYQHQRRAILDAL